MKYKALRRFLPFHRVATLSTLLLAGTALSAIAQEDDQPDAAPAAKERTIRVKGKVTTVDAAGGKISVLAPKQTISLTATPTSQFNKAELNVASTDLAVNDKVAFPLITEPAIVTSLNPLTLKIGDKATLTVTQSDGLLFTRHTPLKISDVTANQTAWVVYVNKPDGTTELKNLAVMIVKPAGKPRAAKP